MATDGTGHAWLWHRCRSQGLDFPPGSIGAGVTAYLFAEERSEHTLRAYCNQLAVVLEFLEAKFNLPPESSALALDRSMLRQFGRLHRARRRDVVAGARRWVNWLVEADMLDPRLAYAVPKPPKPKHKQPRSFLRGPQVEKLLKTVGSRSHYALRDTLLYLLYALTGARNTEVRELRIDQLEIEGPNPQVCVLAKGGEWQTKPLPPEIVPLLTLYLASLAHGTPYLFPSPSNPQRPLSMRTVQENLARHAAHAGLGSLVTPHAFRRGAATDLAAARTDPRDIQVFLGHRNASTTQRYIDDLPERKRAAVERLSSALDLAQIIDLVSQRNGRNCEEGEQ